MDACVLDLSRRQTKFPMLRRAGIRWLLRTPLLISPKLEKVVILKVVSFMNILLFCV